MGSQVQILSPRRTAHETLSLGRAFRRCTDEIARRKTGSLAGSCQSVLSANPLLQEGTDLPVRVSESLDSSGKL
jgi:hypothetical protein